MYTKTAGYSVFSGKGRLQRFAEGSFSVSGESFT